MRQHGFYMQTKLIEVGSQINTRICRYMQVYVGRSQTQSFIYLYNTCCIWARCRPLLHSTASTNLYVQSSRIEYFGLNEVGSQKNDATLRHTKLTACTSRIIDISPGDQIDYNLVRSNSKDFDLNVSRICTILYTFTVEQHGPA